MNTTTDRKIFRAKLFASQNMEELIKLLATVSPPLLLSIPPGDDQISYPSTKSTPRKRRLKKKDIAQKRQKISHNTEPETTQKILNH